MNTHSAKGQLVTIGIGGAGINILGQLLTRLELDHYPKSKDQPYFELREAYRGLFFEETEKFHWARSIICDMNSTAPDDLICTNPLFSSDSVIQSNSPSQNNWAYSFYTEGRELKSAIGDKCRRHLQEIDHSIGVWLFNSLSGGAGSGLTTLLSQTARQEFSHKIIHPWCLIPRQNASDNILEVYNAVLSMHHLIEEIDAVTFYDNAGLMQACKPSEGQTFKALNEKMIDGIMDVSASWRFGGLLNSSIRKSLTNLIPFPRMHFFANCLSKSKYPSNAMVDALWEESNVYLDCKLETQEKSMFTQFVVGRGVPVSLLENQLYSYSRKHPEKYKEWMHDCYQIAHCHLPNPVWGPCCAALINTPAVLNPLRELATRFTQMFRRKAYLHYYIQQGMDEMEFTEAESNLNDLISQYYGIVVPYGAGGYFDDQQEEEEEEDEDEDQ